MSSENSPFSFFKSKLDQIIVIVIAGIVFGIYMIGDTIGWRSLLSSFSPAQITITSTSRSPSSEYLADEKLWIELSQVDTDHVYWVFDESANAHSGGIQLQHTFPFDTNEPEGIKVKRRIDAFYKIGDDYHHAVTRVTVLNIKINTTASLDTYGLTFTLPTQLPGDWKLSTVQLARLHNGKFQDIAIKPETSSSTATNASVVWNGLQVASKFGYTSLEEAGLKLLENKIAWISAEYQRENAGEKLTVMKPLNIPDKL